MNSELKSRLCPSEDVKANKKKRRSLGKIYAGHKNKHTNSIEISARTNTNEMQME